MKAVENMTNEQFHNSVTWAIIDKLDQLIERMQSEEDKKLLQEEKRRSAKRSSKRNANKRTGGRVVLLPLSPL